MRRQIPLSPYTRVLSLSVQDILVILCLLALHGAFFVPAVITYGESVLGRNPLFFMRVIVAIVTCGLVVKAGIRQVLNHALKDRLLVILHGFVVLSTLWSIDRGETISAAAALVLVSLLGTYISYQYDMPAQIRIYTVAVFTIVILSGLVAIFLPQFGVMSQPEHLGRWNGILNHKNTLGYITMLYIIIVLYLPWQRSSLVLLLISLIVLFFTKAAAAAVITGFVLLSWVLYLLWNRKPKYRKAMLLCIVLAIVGLLLSLLMRIDFESILGLLGRNSTLTGRSPLWNSALTIIAERPILGYGYLASFSPASPIHQYLITWTGARMAHNIVLDMTLELGLVGLGVFAAHYVRTFIRAFRLTAQAHNWGFAILFLIFFVVSSLVDSNGLLARNMYWVTYVALALTIAHASSAPSDAAKQESS